MLNDKTYPYNTLPLFKYATKTEFVEEQHAPKSPDEAKQVDIFLNLIKADIKDALEFEIDQCK